MLGRTKKMPALRALAVDASAICLKMAYESERARFRHYTVYESPEYEYHHKGSGLFCIDFDVTGEVVGALDTNALDRQCSAWIGLSRHSNQEPWRLRNVILRLGPKTKEERDDRPFLRYTTDRWYYENWKGFHVGVFDAPAMT